MSRAAFTLVLELVFFVLAFGWRSWVQWRRTGSTGFVRVRLGAGRAEVAGSVGFLVALLLLVLAPLADIRDLARIPGLDNGPAAILGAALALAGIGLTLAAQLAMGDSWRVGVDPTARTELVTRGLFAHLRNPMFTAMILAAGGVVLLVPNLVSVSALIVLVGALQIQVRLVEEPYLHIVHGVAYERYRAGSGRFLPRWRAHADDPDAPTRNPAAP